MEQLLALSYGNRLHKCRLHPFERPTVTIGKEWSNHITDFDLDESLLLNWDSELEAWKIGEQVLYFNKANTIQLKNNKTMRIWIATVEEVIVYDTSTKYSIAISKNDYDDITVHDATTDFLFIRETLDEPFKINVYEGNVFHNYSKLEGTANLEAGDHLYFDGVTIQIGSEDVQIFAAEKRVDSTLPRLLEADSFYHDEYPDYHRSPRIIYREPVEKMIIAKPSSKPSKPTEHLARIIVPSLVMIVVTVMLSIFQSYGLFIFASLAMTVVTVVVSITSYIKNLKQYKIDIAERDKSYREYLMQKTKDLHAESEKQRHALHYHYPDVTEIREMAIEVNPRIYEKTIMHHDFLTYRVGKGNVDTSFEIEFNEEEFSQFKDELIAMARELRQQYLSQADVPVVTDLMNGPVGYIGQRSLVLEQLQLLVMQTALFHSYYDLQFITVFPEEEKKKWDWMRWLPHASVRDINVRGFVYHDRSRDQVLNSLYQILKERKLKVDEKSNSSEKIHFSPHYVVLITDEKLILDHVVMEFFNEDPSDLGVSLVFVQDVMQSLPEHVKTVVDIRDSKKGNIILEQGELVNRQFAPDHFPEGFNLEDVARALAPLNHLQNLKNSIPESVTFLEMYGVEKVNELNITGRWAKNAAHKSLAVPLGLRGKEDLVNLNLHEKAHGPHGLIAGTTGSGKSEIIQSYILSLAVNFHPYEVAFLLIDYKGGGMANLFRNLPHLLGTITNLDGAQSMRALASIKAELQKRQRLFGENNVNHINQYQKLYKEGVVTEPMPHLFLISDEFAELKAEQPEFMKELVSTARIGRSLGIHLILATQKPTGVVDDQIWSNSKFKLALKVQNTSDSNEILKTPDAAEITLPGRAYLQVGNNEIYELFQSAWSGADYVEDKDDQDRLDTTIYAINDLGQYEILSEDLSGLGNNKEIATVPSELDAVIDYIHDYTEERQIEALARPWLPPLPEKIFLQDLHPVHFKEAWNEAKKPLQATVGLLDQPELQSQTPLTLDISKDGHVAVFSSPGYGKSTFLQSVIMDVARQNSPEHLHVYLVDLGTNGLLPLKGLPHVADTITIDEAEKCLKLVERLTQEMKQRKRMLSEYDVASIEMYEKASGKQMPNIIVTIDNYDAVKEARFYEDFEMLMIQIVRDGASLGIHTLISAGRQNALRIQLYNNIKLQTCLYMIDQSEISGIVGRSDVKVEEMAGRAIIKLDSPTLFQSVLPTKAEDELQQIQLLQQEASEMDQEWDGERPKAIPMMPEIIDLVTYRKNKDVTKSLQAGKVPLGLDFTNVEVVAHDIAVNDHLMVYSTDDSIRKQVISSILSQMNKDYFESITLVDTAEYSFVQYKDNVTHYIVEENEVNVHVKYWMEVIRERSLELSQARQEGREIPVFTKQLIIMTNVEEFSRLVYLETDDATTLMDLSRAVGIYFVLAGHHDYMDRNRDALPMKMRSKLTAGIIAMPLNDQSVFNVKYVSNEAALGKDEVYYYQKGSIMKLKMPRVTNEVTV
ncbi:type VII secretion protein EssC [Bacillus pseudomycoides]|nr:type VII secretion protein EssC [Bacillus pseudomycoides]PED05902.1 type VII secretion protein EssC [Bacillus pseudomycoides]PEI98286.1 type VII secretion protein EssC [Bacillus pseudomycoides]PEK28474.1 type VII secretion protein EssC [Bacillus pseudomycoides]PEM69628.1 type VII secretion protein EssC [Bacillus pseudomycoides]PEO22987.1 type VII secretion protein EssC [Bacillus pseudomycoides]